MKTKIIYKFADGTISEVKVEEEVDKLSSYHVKKKTMKEK